MIKLCQDPVQGEIINSIDNSLNRLYRSYPKKRKVQYCFLGLKLFMSDATP